MINSNKLKGRMMEKGLSQQDAAKALGIAQPTFSQKCSGIRDFKVTEVQQLVLLLDISDDDVAEYFFAFGKEKLKSKLTRINAIEVVKKGGAE